MSRSSPGSGAARKLLIAGALALMGLFDWAPPASPRLPAGNPVRERVVPASKRAWTVAVDGWIIQVDGVSVPGPQQSTRSVDALETHAEEPAVDPLPPSIAGNHISRFDTLIHRHAAAEGLDWRLVSALVFEESRFRPDSVSSAGAFGLMQIMPIAARQVQADRYMTPDDNVRTGVRYLKHLEHLFPHVRGRDRLALVLAAYNMGPAHVRDAQVLARHYGFDPNRWDALSQMLPLLENADYYRFVDNGYAQGTATVAYVDRILERYERYKMQANEWPVLNDGPPATTQAASARG